MVAQRDKRLNVLVSADELDMLQALAEKAGVTASDWVRLRIREAFNAEKPKRTKK
jgi:hypothetical protein